MSLFIPVIVPNSTSEGVHIPHEEVCPRALTVAVDLQEKLGNSGYEGIIPMDLTSTARIFTYILRNPYKYRALLSSGARDTDLFKGILCKMFPGYARYSSTSTRTDYVFPLGAFEVWVKSIHMTIVSLFPREMRTSGNYIRRLTTPVVFDLESEWCPNDLVVVQTLIPSFVDSPYIRIPSGTEC